MTEKELMLAEKLYLATDKNLLKDRARAKELCRLINNTGESQIEYRQGLFRELLTRTGNNFWIEPPFYADYGYNIYLGDNFYANYDCIILDIAKVEIGSNVLFGPRVCIFTASHPIDANIRNMQLEFGKSVSIADNVWIGGNTVINPGVKMQRAVSLYRCPQLLIIT